MDFYLGGEQDEDYIYNLVMRNPVLTHFAWQTEILSDNSIRDHVSLGYTVDGEYQPYLTVLDPCHPVRRLQAN